MIFDSRFRSSYALALLLSSAVACGSAFDGKLPPENDASAHHDSSAASNDANSSATLDAHSEHDAGLANSDAALDGFQTAIDAGGSSSDAGIAGMVSCYSENNPDAMCTLPTHCCFSNYSAQHNGACSNEPCDTKRTIECDGPEDCQKGQFCCAQAIHDSAQPAAIGYIISCQTTCGAPDQELCHPTSSSAGTCSSSTSHCVTALNNNNDLPRSLSICQ